MECICSILSDKRICDGSKNCLNSHRMRCNEWVESFPARFPLLAQVLVSVSTKKKKKKNHFVWCFYLCHFHFVFSGQAFENIKQTGKVGTKNADSVVSVPPTFFWREKEVESWEPFGSFFYFFFNTVIPNINIDWVDNIFETLLFIGWFQTQLWSCSQYLSLFYPLIKKCH